MDVVVVGAGLAGLSCASRLVAAGLDVVVLEGRDRVGGRVEGGRTADGVPVELGGQWIGPTQHRVRALAAELGLELFPTHVHGDALYDLRGRQKRTRDGANPPLGPAGLIDVATAVAALHRLARQVDPERPWEARHAARTDDRTFADWLGRRPTPVGRLFWQLFSRAVFSAEPGELSLLHVLFYVRSAGSVEQLMDTGGGAQQDRVVGGSVLLAERLAERLGEQVRLGHVVQRVLVDGGVTVRCADGLEVRADRAVLTLPPTLAGRLTYDPPLPAPRDQLTQRVPMGAVLKLHVVYDRPFWRDAGLSGTALSDGELVQVVFDNSPPDASCGVLLAFVEGADAVRWGPRSAAERHAAVVARLVELFGPEAARPREVVERDWTAEPLSRGCYGGYLPPGVWTSYGEHLRAPIGPLHWAGAELATMWAGYMEGALRSGEQVADEVASALRP